MAFHSGGGTITCGGGITNVGPALPKGVFLSGNAKRTAEALKVPKDMPGTRVRALEGADVSTGKKPPAAMG